jgi:hypothetical protein
MPTFAENVKSLGVTGLSIPPQSLASTASSPGNGNWVLHSKARALGVVTMCGAIAGSGSVTFKLQQASDANGTSAADVTGMTTLVTYADTDDGLVKVAEIPATTLATVAASAKPYLALICTTTSATVLVSAAVVMLDPMYVG